MKSIRDISVSFSGHRNCTSSPWFSREVIDGAVEELYGRGFRRFLGGTAIGFDTEAAESVMRLRAKLAARGLESGITLVSVLPYAAQGERFTAGQRRRLTAVLDASDEVVTLSPHYYPTCYLRRDDYLVEQCSHLLCFYDGSKSGTGYTVGRARSAGIPVTNLYPNPQLELSL